MAGTPQWKIETARGEYVAACKYAEDAAAMVAIQGDGARIKFHGRIVWREGREELSAGESYDRAAEIIRARRDEIIFKVFSINVKAGN